MFHRLFPLFFAPALAFAAEHRVSSAAELAKLSPVPGDTVVMADGAWQRQRVVFRAAGTADRPVTLRAATAGKVLLEDDSSLEIDGEHLVISGVWVKDGRLELRGRDNRLTECAVTGGRAF